MNNKRWHFSTKYLYHEWLVIQHKFWVLYYIVKFSIKLIKRGILHDITKMVEPEASQFTNAPNLKNIKYGSPEYKQSTDSLKECLIHHYHTRYGSHHFQHYKNKFRGMSALDRIEMCSDWLASTRKTKDGNIYESLEFNQQRAGYSNYDKEFLKLIIEEMK